MSDKDFATPLGTVPIHRQAAARLKELYGADRLRGEQAHRLEHSVEFQTLFLKYLHPEEGSIAMLPILCGSLEDHMEEGNGAPRQQAEVGEFCDALRSLIQEFGPRVCVVASVDLSHVGLKFGDPFPADDLRADIVRSADMSMLELIQHREPEAFFDHFRPDRNARKVDAVTAVYTMLHAIGPGPAELLDYKHYREHDTHSMVSYASMAFYRE